MVSLITSSPTNMDESPAPTRPLPLIAVGGGLVAAMITLAGSLTVGMLGWFLADSGAHGAPRDGLRIGALGWLSAHRSAVTIERVSVTMVPLLVTLLCAIVVWKVAQRGGDVLSGHGPDADRLADGERDWTVPVATGGFATGYGAVLLVTQALLADSGASLLRVLLALLVLTGVLVFPAVAAGSGRAAIWASQLPSAVVPAALATRRVVLWFCGTALALLVAALALNAGTFVNVISQLQLNKGGVVAYLGLTLVLVPNAVLCAGSYLLGGGFAVGVGTTVAPSGVVVGALPLFPLLAAVPGSGEVPVWSSALIAVPVLVAACAVGVTQRRFPTVRWEEGIVRGLGAGVAAGVVVVALLMLAGGSVGPGRMQQVGPFLFDALLHAITSFGLGGLIGGVALTWWQRRSLARSDA